MRKIIIGEVVSGTLRMQDLIPAFIDEILYYDEYNKLALKTQESLYNIESDDDAYWESDIATQDYEDLVDQLNIIADSMPYCYFGTAHGDGASFGFWIDAECALEDTELKVSDLSNIPSEYSGEVIHVNDHGNITLYHTHAGKLTEIWGLV